MGGGGAVLFHIATAANALETIMQIPYKRLTPALLHELLREIVTRDGTDYGAVEVPAEERVAQAVRALEQGRAVLHWDAATETASLHRVEAGVD